MCSFMSKSHKKNLEWYLVLQPSLILFSLMFGLVLFVVFLLVELLLGLKVKRKTISIHCTGILFSNSIDCDVKIRKSACILIQTFFCQSTNTYSFFYWLYFYPDYFLSSTNSARKRNKIGNLCPSIDFSNFSCMFLNPNFFFPISIKIVLIDETWETSRDK